MYLVATPGGHLDLLLSLRDVVADHERVWVTCEGSAAQALIAEDEEIVILPRFHGYRVRNLPMAARALARGIRERPGVIVTSGSGNVVPFCLAGRAGGGSLVFLETMARVSDASSAGKVLSRFADSVLVQWPEMLAVYPGARVARPALLEEIVTPERGNVSGEGTFVAVGTHVDQFDRLLRTTDSAVAAGVLPGPAVAQTGASNYRPEHMDAEQWMRPGEIDAAIARASYVVCHAGSGIIARSLNAGRTPIVMPRLARHGEHVDDHQLQLARKLGDLGLVVPVTEGLAPAHLDAARDGQVAGRVSDDLPAMRVVLAETLARLASR